MWTNFFFENVYLLVCEDYWWAKRGPGAACPENQGLELSSLKDKI